MNRSEQHIGVSISISNVLIRLEWKETEQFIKSQSSDGISIQSFGVESLSSSFLSFSLSLSLSFFEWNILRCITQKVVALMNFGDARYPVAVFIKFEAVIARICNEDVTVLGEGQTLWTVKRIAGTIHTLQIRTKPVENLL